LANAGFQSQTPSTPAGVVVDGTGTPVKDSSGNPVQSGSGSSTDAGITKTEGQEIVQPTCPAEYLAKTTTYSPASNFGATTPNLSVTQAKAMMAELGYFLSQFNYSYVSSDGTKIGKYAVDAQYLAAAGYIKPDAVKQYTTATLSNPNSWTGRDNISSQSDFFNSTSVQDTIQFNEFTASYTALVANGGIKSGDDVCTAAGMMFVMHEYRTADATKQWRADGMSSSTQMDPSITGGTMYNHGRYAVDVLAAGGAVASSAQAVGLSGTNTTGINPDDVFTFQTSGSGTRDAFDQLNGTFKDAILKMAKAYQDKMGRNTKITLTSAYRSPAAQDAIYQKWLAAGGRKPGTNGPSDPGVPTAGGITTPALPLSMGGKGSPHNQGAAIDSSDAATIKNNIDLSSFGLVWGGTFSPSDPVHIQLANNSR
jgi:hypothetical protein